MLLCIAKVSDLNLGLDTFRFVAKIYLTLTSSYKDAFVHILYEFIM